MTKKEIVVDGVNIIETKNSYKIWSDKLGRYYYKSKDPNYYNDYFQKTKKLMICPDCGRSVTCQMYNHKKSQYCINARRIREEMKKENTD
jgi:hypothetical protein